MRRIFALCLAIVMLSLCACKANQSNSDGANDPIFDDSGFNSIGGLTSEEKQDDTDLTALIRAVTATSELKEYSATCQTTLSLSVEGVSVELNRIQAVAFADEVGNGLFSSDTDIKDEHNRFTGQISLKRYSDKQLNRNYVCQSSVNLSGASGNSVSMQKEKYKVFRLDELFYTQTDFADSDIVTAKQTKKDNTAIYSLTFTDTAAKRMTEALLKDLTVSFKSENLTVSHFEITVNVNSGLMTERTLSVICTVAGDKPQTYSLSRQFSLKSNRTSELSRPDWAK